MANVLWRKYADESERTDKQSAREFKRELKAADIECDILRGGRQKRAFSSIARNEAVVDSSMITERCGR